MGSEMCIRDRDVVAAEQQAVFQKDQAQVVGSVAGGVNHLQGMGYGIPGAPAFEDQKLLILQGPVGRELAGLAGRRLSLIHI